MERIGKAPDVVASSCLDRISGVAGMEDALEIGMERGAYMDEGAVPDGSSVLELLDDPNV